MSFTKKKMIGYVKIPGGGAINVTRKAELSCEI